MSQRVHRPGEIVPTSGQYAVVNVFGRKTGREVTCVKGERFPPTLHSLEHGFVLVDAVPSMQEDAAEKLAALVLR